MLQFTAHDPTGFTDDDRNTFLGSLKKLTKALRKCGWPAYRKDVSSSAYPAMTCGHDCNFPLLDVRAVKTPPAHSMNWPSVPSTLSHAIDTFRIHHYDPPPTPLVFAPFSPAYSQGQVNTKKNVMSEEGLAHLNSLRRKHGLLSKDTVADSTSIAAACEAQPPKKNKKNKGDVGASEDAAPHDTSTGKTKGKEKNAEPQEDTNEVKTGTTQSKPIKGKDTPTSVTDVQGLKGQLPLAEKSVPLRDTVEEGRNGTSSATEWPRYDQR